MSHTQTDPVLISVQSSIAGTLNILTETISTEAPLADLDLDSLGCMELALRMERAFGHEVPDEVVDGSRTVAEVARYVRHRLPEMAFVA